MGRRCGNFLDSDHRRPENTPLILLKLKKLESISTFDISCSKYFEPKPVPSWHLRQWCNTARCCVSFICCGLFVSEVFIWNNSLNVFPRFCVAKQKPAYSYSCISLFISIIWLSQGHSGPLLRDRPDLTALQKPWTMLLISSKNFRDFFPSFLHFPDSKG